MTPALLRGSSGVRPDRQTRLDWSSFHPSLLLTSLGIPADLLTGKTRKASAPSASCRCGLRSLHNSFTAQKNGAVQLFNEF